MFFNDELREAFKKNDENWEAVPTTLTPPWPTWESKQPNCVKACEHRLRGYGFSPERTLKCILKLLPIEKVFGHWLQGNGCSPECIPKCMIKLSRDGKAMVWFFT